MSEEPLTRSLFVISLPRSLSTVVYHTARKWLGLAEPTWTTDGEILNNDRFVMYRGAAHDEGRKFTDPAAEPLVARQLEMFVAQTVQPFGYAYKDVVQPLVITNWLRANAGSLSILRIRRDVADVALSMLRNRWLYPSNLHEKTARTDMEAAFLHGLLDAEAALASVPAVEVDYDALIDGEQSLRDALHALAPHGEPAGVKYIDAEFRDKREECLRERDSERHRLLRARIDELRETRIASR